MAKLTPAVLLSIVTLNEQHPTPLYQQIYEALRGAILTGQIERGTRLPASRELAAQLAVSRNTVVTAYDQLLAEGFLVSRTGSGSFVPTDLPDDLLNTNPLPPQTSAHRHPSVRGQRLTDISDCVEPNRLRVPAFTQGQPALDAFPYDIWARLQTQRLRYPKSEWFGYHNWVAGYPPLREAIASYLQTSRGLHCTADQIIITNGSQQGIFMAAYILLAVGDAVLMEEPGYYMAKCAFRSAGATLFPAPIDEHGIDIQKAAASNPAARVAFVTPSRQFPTGVTMALNRRLELLDWARSVDGWIVEDDYDSEFRYKGRPVPALQGLDSDARVIYIGTFSKVMFPAVRVGYLVAPPDLVQAFTTLRGVADTTGHSITQLVMADFIAEGHFARHIRRMRRLYAERRTHFLQAVAEILGEKVTLGPSDAGLSVAAWLPPSSDDRAIEQAAAQQQVRADAISPFYMNTANARPGLLLGHMACNAAQTIDGLQRLSRVL